MKVIESVGQTVFKAPKGPTYTTEITSVIDDYDEPCFLTVTKRQDKQGPAKVHAIKTVGKFGFEDLSPRDIGNLVAKLDESEAKLPEFSKNVMTNQGLIRKIPTAANLPEEHQKDITHITDKYIPPAKREEKKEFVAPESKLETEPFIGAFTGNVASDELIALTYTDEAGNKEMLVVSKAKRFGGHYNYDYGLGYIAEFDLETGAATKPEDHKIVEWFDRISEHDENPRKNPAYEQLNDIKSGIYKAESSHKMLSPNSILSVRKKFDLPSPDLTQLEKQQEKQRKKSALNVDSETITIVGMNSNETHTAIIAESSATGGNKIIIVPKEHYINDNEVTFVTMDENKANSMNPKGLIISHLSPKDANTKTEMTKWIHDIDDFVRESGLDEDKQNKIMLNTVAPLNNAINNQTNPLSLTETTKLVDELLADEEIKPYKKAKSESKYFIKQIFDNRGYSTVFRDSAHPNETVLANANFRTPQPHVCSAAIYDHKTGQLHAISREEMKARFDTLKADLLSDPEFVQDNDASKAIETITHMSTEGNPHYAPHNDMSCNTATNTLGVLKSLNITYQHAPKAIINEGEHAKSSIKSNYSSLAESCVLQKKDIPGKTMLVSAPNAVEEADKIRIGIYDHKTGQISRTSFKEVNEWQQAIESQTGRPHKSSILTKLARFADKGFPLKPMNIVGQTAADVMNKNGITYEHFPKMMVDLSKMNKTPSQRGKAGKPAGVRNTPKTEKCFKDPSHNTFYENSRGGKRR